MDYLFFIDSDIVLHPHTLRRLLAHDKDIVGGTYVQRVEPHALLGKDVHGVPFASNPEVQIQPGALLEVSALPTGCLLVSMAVFDKLAI